MKPEELMIGDWVMYNPNVFIEDEYEPTKDCYPIQIKNGEDIDLAIEDCYNHIPLTVEILEKNGWIRESWVNYRQEWWLNAKDFYIIRNSDRDVLHHEFLKFNYVHELQHALRVCNIDKEIEL